jgi:hypothetical protein
MEMNHQEEKSFAGSEDASGQQDRPDERLDILHQIEAGELDVERALQRLRGEEESIERKDVLEELEKGQIDVQEAIRRLEGEEEVPEESEEPTFPSDIKEDSPRPSKQWRNWWLVILAGGMGIFALGGWLGTMGGWWWLCAGPTLLLGMVVTIVGLLSQEVPWLHIRVDTGQDTWPRHISLSFPVPKKVASWALRTWGHRFRRLDETAIDELILSLEENFSQETPLYIEVQEDEKTGERVRIFLG